MRPRTLRRRGRFYRRKRSHWRLNLALVLSGVALVGFVVVNMGAGAPAPASDMAKPITAPAPAYGPARTDLAEHGSTMPASTASAPISAPPPRPRRVHSEIRKNRREFDGARARVGVSTVRNVNLLERAPVPRTFVPVVMRSPPRTEGCKACGYEVPF
jgi:hypothetical protein